MWTQAIPNESVNVNTSYSK